MIHDDSPDSAMDAPGAADKAECVRRSVLRGAVVLGAVGIGGALSRIGSGSSSAASLINAKGSTPISGAPATPAKAVATPPKAPAAGTAAKKGKLLGPVTGVPVGGGTIYEKAQVVVTQPTAGVYKAFDAMCTHEKCILADVADGTINCACHGGKYSIADGSVVQIPPMEPLPVKTVTVTAGKLYVI